MKHKTFIAVNLPKDVKNALAEYGEKYKDLPARWTKTDNLHITTVFVGNIEEEEMSKIYGLFSEVIKKHKSFKVNLNKICYGPPDLIPPRMVWVTGDDVKELSEIKENIENGLKSISDIHFIPEKRKDVLHITLARIKEWEWKKIEPEERPEVQDIIDIAFNVDSIELMESVLKRSGPEYKIIESYQLKND